ncbi:MAG: cupredoxin domain-containing protein [Candidatus Sericytochromatia bacterium]|nr:cupredoxin domain-containing protein [Candidatus Sericytochromatia bacterium]
MRKTFFALLLVLPMMAACTATTTATVQPGSSAAPSAAPTSPAGTTPIVPPAGAPGAGGVATGEVKADAAISYGSFNFTPNAVTIKAGQSVSFTNKEQTIMRVIADDGSFDSGSLEMGKTYVQTFSNAGTFTFKHQLNTSARGTITVQ